MGPRSVLFSCIEFWLNSLSRLMVWLSRFDEDNFDNLEVNMRAEPVLLRAERHQTEPAPLFPVCSGRSVNETAD